MTRMFTVDGTPMKTWNVFTGCRFECSYCWARKMVETRLKGTPKYKDCGFKPTFHEKELDRKFKPGEFVFVGAMSDISFAPEEALIAILKVVEAYPDTRFLLQTKDPSMFTDRRWPENVYLGTTIETDKWWPHLSKAPSPYERYKAMRNTEHPCKFISIEPVMDFDLGILAKWVVDIEPEIVEIGYDNYNNHLPEPSPEKVVRLIKLIGALREKGIQVIEKKGLRERLNKVTGDDR